MSLSPSYQHRVRMPHQPQPPEHWPQDCFEVMSHSWLRVWRCPICERVHEFMGEDVQAGTVLACYGNGVTFVEEEG